MEERRPRLGDIVDDYCPRERRLANHVVVAMIGDDIRQTRCTTCDAEHVYKNAKVPPRRKKAESTSALVKQVAEGLAEKPRLSADGPTGAEDELAAAPVPPVAAMAPRVVVPAPAVEDVAPPAAPVDAVTAADAADPDPEAREQEDGPVHRPLIRATLPRLPGEEREARPIPEFTMRQVRDARGFRPGGGRGGNKPGNRGQKQRAAADFRPGVMSSSSWSPSNQRPRGGGQQNGNRPPQQSPRPGGRKKTR
jgi:hypothetical protein